MRTGWIILLIFFFQDDPDPLRFREEIDRFKEADQIHPVEQGIYLFLGSSSIRMWKSLEDDFSGFPVINRGFGGSHTSDVLYFFEDLVTVYQPAKIIFYEGDNDLASGKLPQKVFEDFMIFFSTIIHLKNTGHFFRLTTS